MVEPSSIISPQSAASPPNAQPNTNLATISSESLRRGFEVQSVNLRNVLTFAGSLAVVVVVIFLILWWTLSAWQQQTLVPRAQIPPSVATVQPAPGPFPVVNASANLQSVVNAAKANLTGYGWVDQKAGVVRIPIDRAMTLLLQRGLPARNAKPPRFGSDDAHKLEGDGGQPSNNDSMMK